jgi:PAS domain S-box-containing protein
MLETSIRPVPVPASSIGRDALTSVLVALAAGVTQIIARDFLVLPGTLRLALLWPPTVITLVGLLLIESRNWWILVAASVAAGLAVGSPSTPISVLLTITGINVGQALIAAWSLRLARFEPAALLTVKGMLSYMLLAAGIVPLVLSVTFSMLPATAGVTSSWEGRSITNMLSALAIGPPLLLLARSATRMPRARWLEAAAMLVLLLAAEIVSSGTTNVIGAAAAVFVPLPFLLWAAVRTGPGGVAVLALAVVLARFYLPTPPVAALRGDDYAQAMLVTQVFVIAMTAPILLLAAFLHEWREAQREIRSSNERHQIATAAGQVGAWDLDLVTGSIFVDPALKALLGYEDHELSNHMSEWAERIHPADRDLVTAKAEAHIKYGVPFEVEHRMVARDGSTRWFIARGAVVERDRDGQPVRMTGTDVDVTERRDVEDALHALRAHVQESARAKDMTTFAASIAHEVSQPLSAIVANAQACLRWLSSSGAPNLARMREAVEDIAAESERATEVINRMRRMFGRKPIERHPVHVESLIMTSIAMVQRQLHVDDIVISTRCEQALPPVLGDRVQLQQVLGNLVNNAITALRATTSPRALTIDARREGQDRVRIEVCDTGAGIDSAHLSRIFEPFFSTTSDGLGLGLAICKSIVAAHNGDIRATRRDSGETVFEVVLPAAARRAGDTSPRQAVES